MSPRVALATASLRHSSLKNWSVERRSVVVGGISLYAFLRVLDSSSRTNIFGFPISANNRLASDDTIEFGHFRYGFQVGWVLFVIVGVLGVIANDRDSSGCTFLRPFATPATFGTNVLIVAGASLGSLLGS